MRMALDRRCGEQHAITDIYCAKRQRSLVAFPVALVSLLIVAGVAAFLLTGFVGYANCQIILTSPGGNSCWHDPWYYVLYLKEPWTIYLWASAVVLTIQVAILRDPSLRRRLLLALIATLASITIVGLVYLFGNELLSWLKNNYDRLLNVVELPITYAIINFAIIVLYFLSSAVRWIRHPDGLKLIGIRSAPQRRRAGADEATLEELISGDLLTGMVLFFIMAEVFTKSFLEAFYKFTTLSSFLSNRGILPANITNVPVSLSTTDTVLALLCLFMGFMSLALTGLLAGLAVLQGTDPAASQVANRAATEVVFTVLNALRAAITRQLRGMVRQAGYTTRRALWPLLLLSGSFCLALFGRYLQAYLHHLDDPTYNCQLAYIQATHNTVCAVLPNEVSLLLAVGLGLAGVLATILSTALQLRSWRVASNAFGFLRWAGLVALITFWMFSVALFTFNILLLQLGIAPASMWKPVSASTCPLPSWYNIAVPLNLQHQFCTQPFVPMSYPTLISFVAFLIVVGILLVRLRQGIVRRTPSPSASTTVRGMPVPRATSASTTTSTTAPATRGVRAGDAGR